jgi:hypothetical protein
MESFSDHPQATHTLFFSFIIHMCIQGLVPLKSSFYILKERKRDNIGLIFAYTFAFVGVPHSFFWTSTSTSLHFEEHLLTFWFQI